MARLALSPDDDAVIDLSLKNRQKPETRSSPSKTNRSKPFPLPAADSTDENDGLEGKEIPKKRLMRRLGSVQPCVAVLSGDCTHASCNDSQVPRVRQRPLQMTHVNSLLLPLSQVARDVSPERLKSTRSSERVNVDVRATPRRTAKQSVDYASFGRWGNESEADFLEEEDEEDEFTDLSGFIVSDRYKSEKVDKVIRKGQEVSKGDTEPMDGKSLEDRFRMLRMKEPDIIDLRSPPKLLPRQSSQEKENMSPRKPNISLDDDPFTSEPPSLLNLSPSKQSCPSKPPLPCTTIGFVTPPSSPSKPRLQSPSKTIKNRIPHSPHRPSIDAFWSQEVINEWNDQYSPKKTPGGRLKNRHLLNDSDSSSSSPSDSNPPTSPRKPPTSPTKRPVKDTNDRKQKEDKKAALTAKKDFDAQKQALAESFLKEIDDVISNGQVRALSASTGGVKIVWSNKLNSTAGRANWKREVIRRKQPSISTSSNSGNINSSSSASPIDFAINHPSSSNPPTHPPETQIHHHASIELATKVIDNRSRLLNTIAHEYCHLANFMISNVKNNPHGTSFKCWAAKATKAFGDRGVEVTTKHSYEIAYKYCWCCRECGTDYQRHSRSIDTERQRCGKCRGALVQIRPKPRKNGDGKAANKSGQGRGDKEKGQRSEMKQRTEGRDEGVAGEISGIIKELEVIDLVGE